jgi:hypothetical protein
MPWRRIPQLVGIILLMVFVVYAWVARDSLAGVTRERTTVVTADGYVPFLPDSAAIAPDSVRIRIHVLNATRRAGLARRATHYLRDHGYDVVDYGSVAEVARGGEEATTTVIEVAPAFRVYSERIRRALRVGAIRDPVSPLAYADVVVRIGRDWNPPPEAFRP